MLSRLGALLLIGLGAGPSLAAQGVPDSVLVSALASRTGGPGGCAGIFDTSSVAIRFFPDVDFLAATCVLEHGDPYSAVVGRDAGGALYLFGDRTSLQFLLDRHAPPSIPPEDRIEYAQALLELSGRTTRQAIRLDSVAQIPPAGRRAIGVDTAFVTPEVWTTGPGFTVRLVTSTLNFDSETVQWWTVLQIVPDVVLIDTAGAWHGPPITRFTLPRTPSDSALASAARRLSVDYGAVYASSCLRQPDGLQAIMDITPRLSGPDTDANLSVLFEQMVLWQDEQFAKVLRTRSGLVQRSVVGNLVQAVGPKGHWEDWPSFAALARSLGIRLQW